MHLLLVQKVWLISSEAVIEFGLNAIRGSTFMNRLAIVITAVLLTAHNLCLAIAQEKTEYDYGGGDY